MTQPSQKTTKHTLSSDPLRDLIGIKRSEEFRGPALQCQACKGWAVEKKRCGHRLGGHAPRWPADHHDCYGQREQRGV